MTAHPTHRRTRATFVLCVVTAVLAGTLTATQTRINGQLAVSLGDGTVAALISFGSGLVIVSVILAFSRNGRQGLRMLRRDVRSGGTPWYLLTGGLSGAFFVMSQGLTAALLGVALFTMTCVAAQTVAAAAIDRFGLGGLDRRPVTALRTVASLLAVAAVIVSGVADVRGDVPVLLLVFPLVAGALVGWQQAVNGHVRIVSGSAVTATFLNFVLGTAALALVVGVRLLMGEISVELPTEPWLYVGGAIGVIFIGTSAVVVRVTGVLVLSLSTLCGQLIGAIALDLVTPVEGHVLSPVTVVGAVVTLFAVTLAVVATRPRAAHSDET